MSDHQREPRPGGDTVQKPGLLDRLRGLFGLAGASIRDDIQEALEESTDATDFSPQERTMLKNVLGLHELRVDDVMVPRADIIAVAADASLGELLTLFRTAGHSRLPVHGDTLDDPRGMVHIRDFVDHLAASADVAPQAVTSLEAPRATGFGNLDLSIPLASTGIVRSVLYAPPSMPALDLLVRMQATRTHMALVIDEYGGTDGLVSIEDIVETIVGDIEDEHDEEDAAVIVAAPDGSLIASARASLDEVAAALKTTPEALMKGEDVDTLGGLIVSIVGRVPVRGELIAGPDNLEFEILDADPRRIKRLKIVRDAGDMPADNRSRSAGMGVPDGAVADARTPAGHHHS